MKLEMPARSVRFALAALATIAVGALIALGISAPAFASPLVTTTLKLTSKTGAALSGYEVYPIDVSDGNELSFDDPQEAIAVSGKPGYYAMPLAPGDTYTLAMYPGGAALNSACLQYLGGSATLNGATTFSVSATDNFVAASIATGGTITGKVTGPTGLALKGADVSAFRFDGTNWNEVSDTVTGSTGLYTFANAVPGSYKFEFYSSGGIYPPLYSGSSTTLAGASSSYLAVGSKVTVNQKFVAGTGAISGQAWIEFPATNESFPDDHVLPVAVPVTASIGLEATAIDLNKSVAGARSDSDGDWRIRNLLPGAYVIELIPYYFQEPKGFAGAGQVISPLLSGATLLTVTAGQTTPSGFTIVEGTRQNDGADPRFTVVDASNTPIAGASVDVTSTTDPSNYADGTSLADGTVRLTDPNGDTVVDDGLGDSRDNPLEPGEYTVTVIDPAAAHDPYKQDMYLDFGTNQQNLVMPNLTTLPGFSVAPYIPTEPSAVGTGYQVLTGPTRSGEVLSYQWLRNGSPIFDATSAGYQSVGADLGSQLSVRVSGAAFGFATVYAYATVGGSTPTPTTIGSAPVNVGLPSVTPASGLFVGSTLQANSGAWKISGISVPGLHYDYTWNTPTGGHGSTYVVQPGDVGQDITVSVTATKIGYASSAPSTSVDSIDPGLHPAAVVTKSPVVTKKTVGGVTTWSVTNGSWSLAGLAFTYVWLVGGDPQGVSSKITSAQLSEQPGGDPLTVQVTARRVGYTDGLSAEIVAVKGTNAMVQSASPTIHDGTSGTDVSDLDPVHFGDHLTIGAHGTWVSSGGGPVSYAYQWFRGVSAIKGATTASYIVTTADMVPTDDEQISVRETAVSPQYPSAIAPLTAVGLAKHIPLPTPAPAADLTGLIADGHSVGVSVGSFGITGVTLSYQWYACPDPNNDPGPCAHPIDTTGFTPITGATKSTIIASHANQLSLFAAVTASKPGYLTATVDTPFYVVDEPTQIVVSQPVALSGLIANAAHVGQKLTAIAPPVSIAGVTHQFTWFVRRCDPLPCTDFQPVGTGTTYTPTATDLADTGEIRVQDHISKGAEGAPYSSTDSFSFFWVIAPGTTKVTTAPKLTVSASTDSVTSGVYVPSTLNGGSVSYQWYEDGLATVSTPTRTRTSSDVSKAIWVDVTYHVDGYPDVVTHLLAQRGTTTALAETITGGTQYGDTLGLGTASPFQDADASTRSMTYQWYENGVAIKGATHSTYAPPAAYVGKHLTVKTTGASTNYATLSVTSTAITVTLGTFGHAFDPTVSFTGTLQPGTVATAVPDTADYGVSAITFQYQWQRSTGSIGNWSTITGATLSHYTPIATDAGDQIRVYVTAVKTGYASVSLPSFGSPVSFSPTLVAFTPPIITGTFTVGGALALSAGVWNTPGLTYSYEWLRNGLPISGVTTPSWTPTADSVGDEIYALVTASRPGYQSVTVSSQAFVVAAASAPIATLAPVISRVTSTGSSYSVSTGTWNMDGLTYQYQWQIGGADASGTGATASTFTTDGSQHGQLSVIVTVTRNGYATPAPRVVTWATLL
ncbi:MAG TPA: hypothetical protein VHZ81_07970 [Galbitalea sp.]|jgi:hypothetical protein|nr:hypothetical protein [Galbitalea sp.]